MARASRPLNIAVDQSLLDLPEVAAMKAKGHIVTPLLLSDYDVVVGPACWRMTPLLLKYWEMMVKTVRKVKYG